MFRKSRQTGFIPVLQSFGASPLEIWDVKVESGCVRRVTDEQVRALVLELSGNNVSTCFVKCPKGPRATLGIHMPYLVMIIKSLKKYFTFEVTVRDDRNQHRRFRMSNFEKTNRIGHFCTSMPLCLHAGWNEVYFDLADFTRKAYKTNYVETMRVQIHANCRVRVIYFCDRIYEDKDIPQKLKIFLPVCTVSRRSLKDAAEKKDSVAEADFFESRMLEEDEEQEEEEEEEAYCREESEKSFAEKELVQRVPSITERSMSIRSVEGYEGHVHRFDDDGVIDAMDDMEREITDDAIGEAPADARPKETPEEKQDDAEAEQPTEEQPTVQENAEGEEAGAE